MGADIKHEQDHHKIVWNETYLVKEDGKTTAKVMKRICSGKKKNWKYFVPGKISIRTCIQ